MACAGAAPAGTATHTDLPLARIKGHTMAAVTFAPYHMQYWARASASASPDQALGVAILAILALDFLNP